MQRITGETDNGARNHDLHEDALVAAGKQITRKEGIEEHRRQADKDLVFDPWQP